jgi:hypothetical protein
MVTRRCQAMVTPSRPCDAHAIAATRCSRNHLRDGRREPRQALGGLVRVQAVLPAGAVAARRRCGPVGGALLARVLPELRADAPRSVPQHGTALRV